MPILNFQERFANAVENGSKKQTIRKKRKIPIKNGDILYLYTGLRTKEARKLRKVKCNVVFDITINHKMIYLSSGIAINTLESLDFFALADGFEDWGAMYDWFQKTHGLPFKGQLIIWD